jgi:nucleoid DNA-binding protein
MRRTKELKEEANNIQKKIIDEIIEETGLSRREIKDILQYTYGVIATTIREGKAEGIRIKNFGAFVVKPKNLKRLKERIELDEIDAKNRAENKGTSL